MRSLPRHILQVLLITLFLTTIPCSESWAVPILDQYVDASAWLPRDRKIAGFIYGAISSRNPFDRSQIFTVGVSGVLTDVEVMVGRLNRVSDPLLWEIRNVSSSGQPGTNVLAHGSAAAASFPGLGYFTYPSDFPSSFISLGGMSLSVDLGDVLAIHLHTVEPTFAAYSWRSTTNVYADGSQFTWRSSTDGWLEAKSQNDPIYAGFQTWVDPVVVPEPSTLLLFGTGALGIFGYARRKRESLS